MTTHEKLVAMARAAAMHHNLDPALVCAVAHHESAGWQSMAVRYEPAFLTRYIEPMTDMKTFGPTISRATEKILRSTSFGLMQVMGQVARELGFTGEWLTDLLTDPSIGLDYGCKQLARKLKAKNGDIRAALLAYNGGGIPDYPDKVLSHYNLYNSRGSI